MLESMRGQEWVLVALALTCLSDMVSRTRRSLLKGKLRRDSASALETAEWSSHDSDLELPMSRDGRQGAGYFSCYLS